MKRSSYFLFRDNSNCGNFGANLNENSNNTTFVQKVDHKSGKVSRKFYKATGEVGKQQYKAIINLAGWHALQR